MDVPSSDTLRLQLSDDILIAQCRCLIDALALQIVYAVSHCHVLRTSKLDVRVLTKCVEPQHQHEMCSCWCMATLVLRMLALINAAELKHCCGNLVCAVWHKPATDATVSAAVNLLECQQSFWDVANTNNS